MTENPVDPLVAHVAGAGYGDMPARVVEKAKTFLLDTLGVGIAGSSGAGVEALIGTVSGWGQGDAARVWLTGERLPAHSAAIVNAYQIHCLEYDCVHEGAVVHPLATILSALIAHAERRSAMSRPVAGSDFLLALALGVDVAAVLGMAATGRIRFFRPATAGGFGAAAAIGKLEGFDAGRLKDALGILYGQTSGTLQPHAEGSMVLGLQIGFNARAALCAVDLATAGVRGPHDVLTGPYGYLRLYEGGEFDIDPVWSGLGRDWQVAQLSHKPFPSGRLTHGVIDGLGRLMAEHGFAADRIAEVVCRVPPLVDRLVGRPDVPAPAANYAKLCLTFVAGAFLARGRVDVPDFRGEAALNDPEVHALAAKVRVERDDNPDENALDPQTILVTLTDGTRHAVAVPRTFGHPEAPLDRSQNLDKFRRCAGYGRRPLSEPQVDRLIDMVDGIEHLDDVTALVDAMVVSGADGYAQKRDWASTPDADI